MKDMKDIRLARGALRRRLPLPAMLIAGALALASMPSLADGEIVQVNPDGSVSRIRIEGNWSGNQYVDCTSGLCNPCGVCHADTRRNYDARRHIQAYFPRQAMSLRDGERLDWAYRGSLVVDSGKLCALDGQRRVRLCVPSRDSWVLKDATGRPLALWSLAAPIRQ